MDDKTKAWAKAAAIRALRTAIEGFLAGLAGCATFGEVRWEAVGMTVLVATLSSVVLSLKGLPEAGGDTPLIGGGAGNE